MLKYYNLKPSESMTLEVFFFILALLYFTIIYTYLCTVSLQNRQYKNN